jgi:hypothetical protein
MKKTFAITIFGAVFTLFASRVYARIGWTLDQCQQAYGQAVSHTPPNKSDAADVYTFDSGGYQIVCRLIYDKVAAVDYSRLDNRALSKQEVRELLDKNSDGAKWSGPKKYDNGGNRPGYQYTTIGAMRGHGLIAFYTIKWGDLNINAL